VWVRGKVWNAVEDGEGKLEVELLVTDDTPISVRAMPMFHLRKIPIPIAKREKIVTVIEDKKEVGVTLSRPGFVAKTPKGLAQAWPFIDAPDDHAQMPLLSTATHVTDESHYMSAMQRGFPAVPEKRYALTAYSAQTLARQPRAASTAKKWQGSQDRWHRTGGYNPGPPCGLYPRRGGGVGGGGGTVATTRARALAGVWGRPAAAPEMPFDQSHAYGMARDPLLPGAKSGGTRAGRSSTAARGGRKGGGASSSVRARSDAYARAHQHDMFTVENR